MKILRYTLCFVLMSVAAAAFAQSDMHKPADTPAPSAAQKSFATMKTLAGEWEGPFAVAEMPEMNDGKALHVSLRVTSRGNAVVHEMQEANTPLDPTKFDHPLTMLYVDGDQLNLIHYCDAGNRPHMVARPSADGKKVEFDFTDLSGGNQYGHMVHAVFTIMDADHHAEDWTYLMPGDKPMQAHMDLQRVK